MLTHRSSDQLGIHTLKASAVVARVAKMAAPVESSRDFSISKRMRGRSG
jgi:hypothetical protein